MHTLGKCQHGFMCFTNSSRIIKDFYIPEPDLGKRPRVFGMTASPVDAKDDPVSAAR